MFDWVGRLFDQAVLIFSVPALLGTVVFLVKMGLMTLGGFGDADVDVDVDLDVDADVDADASTDAFNLLSIQSIAALLMGFGWGGLFGRQILEWNFAGSIALGLAFGFALVWLLGILLKAMYDLQNSGHVRARDAVGTNGVVYANIPGKGEGRGQVRVVVNERARFYTAVSDGDALTTNTEVRIVSLNNDGSLTVTRA